MAGSYQKLPKISEEKDEGEDDNEFETAPEAEGNDDDLDMPESAGEFFAPELPPPVPPHQNFPQPAASTSRPAAPLGPGPVKLRQGPKSPSRLNLELTPIEMAQPETNVWWFETTRKTRDGKESPVMVRLIWLRTLTSQKRQDLNNEIGYVMRLKHKYIVPFFGRIQTREIVKLVFERCKWNLSTEIEQSQFQGTERVKVWIGEIAQALIYLHGQNLAHCRIHPDSILIRGRRTALLTRFGGVQNYYGPGTVKNVFNEYNYLSPQALRSLNRTSEFDGQKDDIWALGCVTYFTFQMRHMFSARNRHEMQGEHSSTDFYISEVMDDEMKEILNFMLNKNESARPYAELVAAHRFFATPHPSSPHHIYGPQLKTVAPTKTFRRLGNTNEKEIKEMEAKGYFIKTLIGQGGYGSVYSGGKVNEDGTTTPMALKVIGGLSKRRNYREINYPFELNFMMTYDHPYIVKVYDVFREKYTHRSFDRRAFIWMEQAQCDLAYKIKSTNGAGLSEEITQKYMRDVVTGLDYLYDQKLAHRDLKPGNILISTTDVAKLTDFSFITEADHAQMSNTCPGTTGYKSPQLLLRVRNNPFKGDVWAFGITILECFLGGRDQWFDASDVRMEVTLRAAHSTKLVAQIQRSPSEDAKDLLLQMLDFVELRRITIKQVYSHPWMFDTPPETTTTCHCPGCVIM